MPGEGETSFTNLAQVAAASAVLRAFGMTEAQVSALFAADMAGVYMRLNTRGGDVAQYQQRFLRNRRASLIEVACYLVNLRVPPDLHKPKAIIRRRMHCQYTLATYVPEFLAACAREHPEDEAFYDWAAEQIKTVCNACLRPAPNLSGKGTH
jgi:hypothetical protein